MKKRFLSLFLALTMAFALAVPAFADSSVVDDYLEELRNSGITLSNHPVGIADWYTSDGEAYGEVLVVPEGTRLSVSEDALNVNSYTYTLRSSLVEFWSNDNFGELGSWENSVEIPKNDSILILWCESLDGADFTSFTIATQTTVNRYIAGESLRGETMVMRTESGTTPISPVSFTDVSAGAFYADAVNWAVKQGITNGTGDGSKFSPTQDCTHAQILTFLYRAARGEGVASAEDMNKAITWAREKGMIGADFNSSAKCTRADAVNYLWQAFDKKSATASSFNDVSASANYAAAVDWAVANGIVNGYDNGDGTFSFRPDRVCDRGTIATLLYRAYVRLK